MAKFYVLHTILLEKFKPNGNWEKGFIRLLELVRTTPNDPIASQIESFLLEVLSVYEKHGMNGHIRWDGSPLPKNN